MVNIEDQGVVSPFALTLMEKNPPLPPMLTPIRVSDFGPTMLPAVQRGNAAGMLNARLHKGVLCVDWSEITAYSPCGSDWQPED